MEKPNNYYILKTDCLDILYEIADILDKIEDREDLFRIAPLREYVKRKMNDIIRTQI